MSSYSFLLHARKLLLFLCLAALLSALGPPPQTVRWNGSLGIVVGPLTGRQSICRGDRYKVRVQVRNINPGLDVPLPVVDAAVYATDNLGRRFGDFTGAFGEIQIDYPTDQEGEFTLTITAHKETYDDAPPETVMLRVRSCDWMINIDFMEEYDIIEQSTVVIGANARWEGRLVAGEARGENMGAKVELEGGGGRYYFYVYDQIKAPIKVTLDQPVEGDFSGVRMDGYLEDNHLKLWMGNEPVSYPRIVNLRVKDYGPNNIVVHYTPPIPTGQGNGLIFDMMGIHEFSFPSNGGTGTYTTGGYGVFFQLPDRKEYELVIRLRPYDASEFLYNPELPSIAGLGRLP